MNSGRGQSSRIAVILINVQNEFVDRNGKLHHIVKDSIDDTNAVTKTIELTKVARCVKNIPEVMPGVMNTHYFVAFKRDNGALIVHATTVSEEGSPCDELRDHFSCDELFTRGSWNADIYPGVFKDGDMIFTTQSPSAFSPEL
jgi:nicotinamidase-related amidase